MQRLLITICGRAGSKGFRNKNLKTFCGHPLVYYSLSAADLFCKSHPELAVDLALNTDSPELAALVADKYPEVVFLPRGEALAGDRVPKMAVYQDSLRRMEQKTGRPYDALMDLDITSPLRTAADVAAAFEKKAARPDLDLVFSEQVHRGEFTGRQQAPEVFDVNASIYVFGRDFLAGNTDGLLWHGKIGVSVMMDTGIIDIDSEHDYQLMEAIAAHLYRTDPAFAAVRDNIR